MPGTYTAIYDAPYVYVYIRARVEIAHVATKVHEVFALISMNP